MWKIAWHSCHKIPFLVFLCFELSQFSLAQQLLSYQLQCLQKVIIVKPCRHLVKCQHWWVWAPPELLLKILLIHLGMHVKALMSFTSHAISKWIAIIIYLWTTIFYLEKCSLWLVFWDEPLLSVFLEQLGTSVEWCRFWFCTSLKESKLIKHCKWELAPHFNNYFNYFNFLFYYIVISNLIFCHSVSSIETGYIYIYI